MAPGTAPMTSLSIQSAIFVPLQRTSCQPGLMACFHSASLPGLIVSPSPPPAAMTGRSSPACTKSAKMTYAPRSGLTACRVRPVYTGGGEALLVRHGSDASDDRFLLFPFEPFLNPIGFHFHL